MTPDVVFETAVIGAAVYGALRLRYADKAADRAFRKAENAATRTLAAAVTAAAAAKEGTK